MDKFLVICYTDCENTTEVLIYDSIEERTGCKRTWYKGVKFKHKRPGAVFKIVENESGSISYNSKSFPIGSYPDKEKVLEWSILQKAADAKSYTLKNIKRNALQETLEPIKAAYKLADYRERQLILAEIIRIVTTL